MKKIVFSIVCMFAISLNAQIFINTNPKDDKKSNEVEVKTKEPVSTKPQEIKTTNEVEKVVEKKIRVNTPEGINTPTKISTSTDTNVSDPVETETVIKTEPVETKTTVTTPIKVEPQEISNTNTTTIETTVTTPKASESYEVANAVLEDVPPNAEPGKCYARCIVPDRYEYVNEQVIDQPRTIKKMKLPELYKTVYDTVVVTPKSTKIIRIPAQYENIDEEVMVSPATTKWVKGKADAGCLSADPSDCQVMCLIEVPAKYKTVSRKVLKNEAYNREITIPMEYKIVPKEVKVKSSQIIEIEIPATYKTVQKRVVAEKGGYQVWREILCADDITSAKVLQIQKALRARGYDPGPVDNMFGPLTKAALVKYQKDKGLPVGNLNIETLRSLGVN